MDPVTLLALFGPALKDGVSALFKKFTGDAGAKPANVQEAVQLMEAGTKQLEARARVGDAEGPTYQWVTAIIKLQRPAIVYTTMGTFLLMSLFDIGSEQSRVMVATFGQVVVFWLFGERYELKLPFKKL